MCLSIAISRPNDVLETGEHCGFEWVVTHNTMGYRCGYVKVPLGHPWHGLDYNDVHADVHGGLTFAEPDEDCGEGGDDAYWLGFDCAHSGDSPDPNLPSETSQYFSRFNGRVRTQEYVVNQCKELCLQAAEVVNV